MPPSLEDYGTDDEIHIIVKDVKPGLSIEITEDDDIYWVAVKHEDGSLLIDESLNPFQDRDNTYYLHRDRTQEYPTPTFDGLWMEKNLDVGSGQEHHSTISPGQYLNRVQALSLDRLANGAPPSEFPDLDESSQFTGLYVVKIEVPKFSEEQTQEATTTDHHQRDLEGNLANTAHLLNSDEELEQEAGARPTMITIFDFEEGTSFKINATDFDSHYGVTIWNTGEWWKRVD